MSLDGLLSGQRLVEGSFNDVDAMAVSPLAWNQEYEQIGRGPFQGHITQLLMDPRPLVAGRLAAWHRPHGDLGFRTSTGIGGLPARPAKAGARWRTSGGNVA
jgi:hypothetical protein